MMGDKSEVDLYRDTPVRYLGYANEIGESFRSLLPKSAVQLSYIVATGYVIADTLNSGWKTYIVDKGHRNVKNVLLSVSDTLLWQTLASIVIPGYTINRICAAVIFMQKRTKNVVLKNRWLPPTVGLLTIPFIVHPIDNAVDLVMDASYRKLTGYYPKGKPV